MTVTEQDLLLDPRLRHRASYPHWVQEHVRWSDTDRIGHANNLAFAAFSETGRALLLRPFMDPDTGPRALLVMAEQRLKFLGEMHWPARIDVGTAVAAIRVRSCIMVQALFDGERCTGLVETRLVLIDEDSRKSRPFPDAVRTELEGWALT
jgi:acyl-CoA thioester hydrolase